MMTADGRTRWMSRAAVAAAALSLVCLTGSAHAQGFMRSPGIGGGAQVSTGPRINPGMGRVDGHAAGRFGGLLGRSPLSADRGADTSSPDGGPRLRSPPHTRHAPRLSAICDDDDRGQCSGRPVASGGGKGAARKRRAGGGGGLRGQDAVGPRTVPNELVAEIDGTLTDAQADVLARRHGLRRIASQTIPLLGATIALFRVTGDRPAEVVSRKFASDASVRSVQPNYRYVLQEQKTASGEGDLAQYALAQLRLPQAHALARGRNVTIAIIDSGIDAGHPELANSVADIFDALGSKEGAHVHGTAIAGTIAARAKLTGSAPEVRILAIRAFGAVAGGAESTSYVILRSLDYAALHGARVVNMSFAGPKDALITRGVAAATAKGIV